VPLALPAPIGIADEQTARSSSVVLVLLSALSISGAVLFLMGLKDFKAKARKAYYFMCAGFVGIGLSYLAFPMSLYISQWFGDFTTYAGQVPLLSGAILLYIGVWQFTRIIQLRSLFWAQPKVVLSVAAVLFVVLSLLKQHPVLAPSKLAFDSAHIIVFLDLVTSFLLWNTRHVIGTIYRRGFLWLALALACKILGSGSFVLLDYIKPANPNVLPLVVLYLMSALFFITAGYQFNKITRSKKKPVTLIDIIIHLGSMVSRPRDIRDLLEPLRVVTSTLPAGAQPSPEQEKQLKRIYQGLQDYIVQKEPLLAFTPETLKEYISDRFTLVAAPGAGRTA
jgi:hypothetical protein